MDPILSKAFEVLSSAAVEKAKEKLVRTESVVSLFEAVGLKPDTPPADFDGVYVYSLVQYGVGRPPAGLVVVPRGRDPRRISSLLR
ncbi:MAG: hypothetical protein HY268_34305 [Deltaproteobacteria bacterium]|nr:hypothetical protein [Deltaproteobacteria bacterium]